MAVSSPLSARQSRNSNNNNNNNNNESTWDKVPTIGGSRWGFIGAMAGIAIVIIIALITIICCVRRSKSRRRMRYAASHGNDLSAVHPSPGAAYGRNASRSQRSKFAPLQEDDDENDAFVASSPRNSMTYGGGYGGHRVGGAAAGGAAGNGYGKSGPSQYEEEMQMDEMNHRYYRGSEGFMQDYNYGRGEQPGYGGPGGYGYEFSQGQFQEPEFTEDGPQQYSSGYGPSSQYTGPPPSSYQQQQQQHQQDNMGQGYAMPAPSPAPPASYQHQPDQHAVHAAPPSYAPSYVTGSEAPAYIPYSGSNSNNAHPEVPPMSPPSKHRAAGANI